MQHSSIKAQTTLTVTTKFTMVRTNAQTGDYGRMLQDVYEYGSGATGNIYSNNVVIGNQTVLTPDIFPRNFHLHKPYSANGNSWSNSYRWTSAL